MSKIDITKYIDLTMEFSMYGAGALMISPDNAIIMLETELGMTCDEAIHSVINSEITVTETGIKRYIRAEYNQTDTSSYAAYTLNYYKKVVKIYKSRIAELLNIIYNMNRAKKGNDIAKRHLKEIGKKYDLMINEYGHIYYKDLDRILNPLIYNVRKLRLILARANEIDNYYSHCIDLEALKASGFKEEKLYPADHLLEELGETPDEGMITLTDRQKRELLKGMNDTKVIQLYL